MPNDIPHFLRSWWVLLAGLLHAFGTAVGFLVAAIKLLLDSEFFSEKPKAEIHKTFSEADLNDAQAQFAIAQATSLEWHDQLSGIEMAQKLMHDGILLEQLLVKKNETIASLEDKVFSLGKTVEEQARVINGYEGQKMEILGNRRLDAAEKIKGEGTR